MRDPAVVRRGIAACAAVLDDAGVLLVQDAALPSVTTLVTGAPVRGSWWAHQQAHSIFAVLETLEADTTTAKLLSRKQTLVHRSRWPALAAVGHEGAAWQYDRLPPDARTLVDDVIAADAPMRADALAVGGPRPHSDVVRDVERRLLVHAGEVHTDSGRHAKVLQSWPSWVAAVDIGGTVPDAAAGRAAFEAAIRTFAPERIEQVLPWPVEVPS
jgi:hypothetical protein